MLGFEEERKDGRTVATTKPHDYTVEYLGVAEATLSVRRPYAYLFPASWTRATENLQRHGIVVEELREDIELDVETYRIDKVKELAFYQKRQLLDVEATSRKEARRIAAGTILVRTQQPLGTLAAYLLEPLAEDGLCTWNFFSPGVAAGADFPVLRLPKKTPLTSGPVRPLPEDRPAHQAD